MRTCKLLRAFCTHIEGTYRVRCDENEKVYQIECYCCCCRFYCKYLPAMW